MKTFRILFASCLGWLMLALPACGDTELPPVAEGEPILIGAGPIADLNWTDHNTTGSGVDYIVEAGALVLDSAVLRIAPGTRIAFSEGAYLQMRNEGALRAEGTVAAPIVFTGTSPVPGHWAGLRFEYTHHPENILEHCVVEYAGAALAPLPSRAAVGSDYEAAFDMQRCTLRYCSGEGLYAWDANSQPVFRFNRVHDCGRPATLCESHLGLLDTTNVLTGNAEDLVVIRGQCSLPGQNSTAYMVKLDVPYAVENALVVSYDLTIAPGVEIVMRQDAQFWVSNLGRMYALGTASEPIIIRGEQPLPGFWVGIYVNSGAHADFAHCLISDAGRASWFGPNSTLSGYFAYLTAQNCTVSNSSGHGISVNGGMASYNADIDVVNTFENIAVGYQNFLVY